MTIWLIQTDTLLQVNRDVTNNYVSTAGISQDFPGKSRIMGLPYLKTPSMMPGTLLEWAVNIQLYCLGNYGEKISENMVFHISIFSLLIRSSVFLNKGTYTEMYMFKRVPYHYFTYLVPTHTLCKRNASLESSKEAPCFPSNPHPCLMRKEGWYEVGLTVAEGLKFNFRKSIVIFV